jgi:HEAT repeat protein
MAKVAEPDVFEIIGDYARRNNWSALADMLATAPQSQARRRAMEVMLASKNEEAFELLADTSAGAEVGLNEEILQRMRDIPGEMALRGLARVLSSENTLRRALVVTHCAKRPEPAALTMLLRGARDPSNAVSRIGERALLARVTENPKQLEALPRESIAGIVAFVPFEFAQELIGPDYPVAVRAEAARRLGAAGGADAVTTLMALVVDAEPALARAAWDGLRAIKDLPATFLLPFLGERRDEIRKQGIELFSRCCGPDAAPILAGLLRDKAASVREATVRALYKLQRDACVPGISKLATDPELCVRRAVVEILARCPAAADELVSIALREQGELHEKAIGALATHGVFRDELTAHYMTYLNAHVAELKPAPDVVDAMAAIAKILGDAHEPHAIEGFAALCRSTSRRLRRTGIEAILGFPRGERGDVLVSLADTHDKNLLSTIAIALADDKDERAVVPLIRTYVECTGRNVRRAHDFLAADARLENTDFLLELLGHKASSVRRFAAGKLKTCKDTKVIDPLLNVSRDEDVEVELASIEALGGFARTEARVVERLTEVCGQGDVTVRQAAVEALGDAGIQSATPVLIKALYNVFLRPRAEEALKKVGGRQGYLAMKRLKRREALFGGRHKRRKERPKLKD